MVAFGLDRTDRDLAPEKRLELEMKSLVGKRATGTILLVEVLCNVIDDERYVED